MFDWCPRPEKDNGIGLHDDGNSGDGPGTIPFMHSLIDAMADLGFSWLKLLTDVNHKSGRLALIEHARRKKIMVIVRPFRQPCHPRGLHLYDDYINAVLHAGCPYIEVGNEPNLAAVECWKLYPGYEYGSLKGHAAFINLLYDQWCSEADRIRRLGGIPLFPGLSPTAYTNDGVFFHHALYEQIIGLGKLRGDLAWAFEGAGIAIHNRPSANPLDAVDRCAFRDYEWIEAQFKAALGREIPLFGTEAGYEDGMVGGYILHQLGNLYPNNDDYIRWHKTLNHEMFARFNPQHPKAWKPYLMCECAWLAADDGWYASGWARNARVGGGALPSFTDMGEISRFTRAEGVPYVPPEEEEPTVPEDLPSGTDEIEFVGLSQELIDRLSVSGPLDPNQPYWKVTAVEVQPNTDNMNAWVLVGDKPHPTPVFFWRGMEVPMEWKGPDTYSPPGCKNGGYAQVMHHCWGSFGVRMDGNTEVLFGIGLYGANLEPTYTGHHPVLVYFELVIPGAAPEPSPVTPPGPEPVPEPEPMPSVPYELVAALRRLGLVVHDLREEVKAISKLAKVPQRAFQEINGIVVHHTASNEPQTAMGIAKYHIETRGFTTIGYHFVIDWAGDVYFVAPLRSVTEHCGYLNRETIGVAVMGDFVSDLPSDVQIRSLRLLIYSLWEFPDRTWGGFRPGYVLPHSYLGYVENNGKWYRSACPGRLKEALVWSGAWPGRSL